MARPLPLPPVLFMGIFNCLNYLTTRQSDYGTLAAANVSKATVGTAVQVSLGILVPGPGGLIVGYSTSNAAANIWLARRQFGVGRRLISSRRQLSAVARRLRISQSTRWARLSHRLPTSPSSPSC